MPKLPAFLERWIADPPPAWVVEFSEQGIFRAASASPADLRFEALPTGALTASPVENNLRDYDQVQQALSAIPFHETSQSGSPLGGREAQVAVLLPDYSVRTSILDFEDFPARREEQEPLVRFRLRKIVPYDLETAQLAFQYFPKAHGAGGAPAGVTVVATTCPLHILAEYEALLRQRRCHPGFISSSALAALSLLPSDDVSVLAKLSGDVMTAAVSQKGILRLIRTVELLEVSWDELLNLLQPMFAMAEDQLGTRGERLWLCGFPEDTAALVRNLEKEFGIPTAELTSRFGTPQAHNAGALGYIQGLGELLP
jgi:type IV pilus assembly protein PilM